MTALVQCGDDRVKPAPPEAFDEIKVMTYNILFNTSNEFTLEVLRETGADIIGLLEASPQRIAELGRKTGF